MIEPSKFSYEAAFKMGMEEFLKKSIDKMDDKHKKGKHNTTLKKTKAQTIGNLKEKADNLRIFSHKNSLGKATRPNTAAEKSHEYAQRSVEHNFSVLLLYLKILTFIRIFIKSEMVLQKKQDMIEVKVLIQRRSQ